MVVFRNRVIRCWPSVAAVLIVVLHFCLFEVNARPGLLGLEGEAKAKKGKKNGPLQDFGAVFSGPLGETEQVLNEHQGQVEALQKKLKKKGKDLPGNIQEELDAEQAKLDKEKNQLKLTQPKGDKEKSKVKKHKEEVEKKVKGLGVMKTLNKDNALTDYLKKKDKKEPVNIGLGETKLDGNLDVPDLPDQNELKKEVKTSGVGEILEKKNGDKVVKNKKNGKALKLTKDKKILPASDLDVKPEDLETKTVVPDVSKKLDELGVDDAVSDSNEQLGIGGDDKKKKKEKGKKGKGKKDTSDDNENSTEDSEKNSTEESEDKTTEESEDKSTEDSEKNSTEDSEDKSTEDSEEKSTENSEDKSTEESQENSTEESEKSTEDSDR